MQYSILHKARFEHKPILPLSLRGEFGIELSEGVPTESVSDKEKIKKLFPNTYGMPIIEFKKSKVQKESKPVSVGVVLSGGQAPGGHNVIAGIFDGLKLINPSSRLYGFLGGPSGLIDGKYIEITEAFLTEYRNTGGFDIIGSGRTKLESEEQFLKAAENCKKLNISAIVVIGGDDSNTNACLLAEFYAQKGIRINVIGCPKTIDGDLKNEYIETSFGFDTACKVYSELIGNIQRDAKSAKKYWHFIKLMGRSASHIALECGLQTHANITLIGEEIADKKMTLVEVIDQVADVVAKRAEKGLNYGVVLIPEGLIEFIPEVKFLISELNELMAVKHDAFESFTDNNEKMEFITRKLSDKSAKVYLTLPMDLRRQLIMDRDPHGNVQVSRIETEKLITEMLDVRLKAWKAEGLYNGKFNSQNHFFGYEGRCAFPSNFDANYCYSLGYTASILINFDKTGYMASIRNLSKNIDAWVAGGIPITMMMNIERRHGEDKPVIQKALVKLEDAPYLQLIGHRKKWSFDDMYFYPGPIQYFGPPEVCDQITQTLKLEHLEE